MSCALKSWINPEYLNLYYEGRLASLRSEDPFPNVALKNFLRPEAIAHVLRSCESIVVERSHGVGIASKADWHWGAFSNLDYIRFFLSQDMRAFMNELIGDKLILKRKSIPQFNIFKPGSKGIPPHTDLSEDVGVVSLFQLSEGYTPGRGGELILYRREGNKILPSRYIEPIANTLILFKVSEKSFHSVADMNGNWTRRTITYDWLSEGQTRVSRSV